MTFKIEYDGDVPLITSPEQVAQLPWGGNYALDAGLFEAVDRYTRKEPDVMKAYQAERLASKLGMGEELPEIPSDSDLEYLKSIYGEEM